MVNFTVEKMREAMNDPRFIRNISICAHVDAGKSTTTDSLVGKCGIIAKKDAGDKCHTDTRADEQERGITIKSTGVSMHFDYNMENEFKGGYLINLIDSPGHVDFSSEVTAALRISDGAVVLIDAVDGVCVQTKTVLRQALDEKIKPVLMINKMDRMFLELKKDPSEMFIQLRNHIEDINVLLSSCQDENFKDLKVDPMEDTVMFGSGYHQWGFTLGTFARIWAPKLNKSVDETKKMLWDYYFFPEENKWRNFNKDNKGISGFVHLILEPIKQLCDSIMDKKEKKVINMLNKIGVKLSDEDMELLEKSPKKLCKLAMTNWLPLSDSLLGMIIEKLPSPKEAQVYRAPDLYTGEDDEVLKAMKECDPNGPVMMYISKMVPLKEGDSRFYAFGRLFSGTIRANQPLKIMGSKYVYGEKTDLFSGSAQQVVSLMARRADAMTDVPCGNTCALVGIDKYLVKTGTLSTSKDAHPIKEMNFSVSPIVRVSVGVKNTADLKKLTDGLKKLQTTDTLVQVIHEESGEIVIAGAGELHLEICLKDLQDFMKGAELVVADPVVPYRETVSIESVGPNLSKSPNKHNRIYAIVEPMDNEMCEDIENGVIEARPADIKKQAKYIADKYGVDSDHFTKRLWGFGPTDKDANLVINATQGTQYMDEIRDSCKSGFLWASKDGPLCEEPLRGVSVKITDVVLHADSIHRGMGQIMPTMRRVVMGSVLLAQPRLQEPIFLAVISVPQENTGGVYRTLSARRGTIVSTTAGSGNPMCTIEAHLPVAESFGFDSDLRGNTGGTAFAQCHFSHWQTIESDPLTEGTLANTVMKKVRERKGLPPMKLADYYIDKL